MPDEKNEDGFELESLKEDVQKRLEKPSPPPPPPPPPPPAEEEPPPPLDESGVDTRTVAEKAGTDAGVVVGERPPPEGWPLEAFSFPMRGDMVGLALAVVLWVVLDFVGWWNLFVGAVLKAFAYVYFLRWQLGMANGTAAGKDAPTSFAQVANVDLDAVKGLGRLIGTIALLLAPAAILFLVDLPAAGVFLLLVGLIWSAVAALGLMVGEPSLVMPWKAFPWMGSRPLGLLASTVGWIAAFWIERLELALEEPGPFVQVLLAIVLRVAFVYLWLLGARALGVVGRAWSPYAKA